MTYIKLKKSKLKKNLCEVSVKQKPNHKVSVTGAMRHLQGCCVMAHFPLSALRCSR